MHLKAISQNILLQVPSLTASRSTNEKLISPKKFHNELFTDCIYENHVHVAIIVKVKRIFSASTSRPSTCDELVVPITSEQIIYNVLLSDDAAKATN